MSNMMGQEFTISPKKKYLNCSRELDSKKLKTMFITDTWRTEKQDYKCIEYGYKLDSENLTLLMRKKQKIMTMKKTQNKNQMINQRK